MHQPPVKKYFARYSTGYDHLGQNPRSTPALVARCRVLLVTCHSCTVQVVSLDAAPAESVPTYLATTPLATPLTNELVTGDFLHHLLRAVFDGIAASHLQGPCKILTRLIAHNDLPHHIRLRSRAAGRPVTSSASR